MDGLLPRRPVIARTTVREVMGDVEFPALMAEYAAESAIEGMPTPNAKMELYLHMENLGLIHGFSAVVGNSLVGFISLLAPVLPHYGATVAVCESFFVTKRHRKSGAGLRLLRAAETMAAEMGSPGLLLSAPVAGKLAELLPRCGYTEASRTFFKKVSPCAA